MTVTINGTSGVSLCDTNSVPTAALQASAVTQTKVGAGVAGNGPAFGAYMSVSQTLSHNTITKMPLNTEVFDTNGNFDSVTNYRFTPTVAGYYQFNLCMSVLINTGRTYYFEAFVYKNGGLAGGKSWLLSVANVGGGSQESIGGSYIVYMNGTTDYVEGYMYMYDYSAASTVQANGASNGCTLQGVLVRAA